MATDTGDYIEAGISTDQIDVRDTAVDAIEAGIPGLVLRQGDLLWLLADQVAEMRVDLALQLLDVARYRFRTFGRTIAGIPPIEATQATGSVTVTTLDPDPQGATLRLIPTGSQVSIADVMFVTTTDVTLTPGASASVTVAARDTGSAGSGLTAQPEFQEPFSFVAVVTLDGVTTGGIDAEPDDTYEDRLARRYQHMGRPILAGDFSERAREIPGVARALTLDGYNADTATSGNERTVTLAVVDGDGLAVSAGVKQDVNDLILGEREVNWDVFVIDPTYTTVNIAATVTVYPGFTTADVESMCDAALQQFLNPALWGNPPVGEVPDWHDEPVVLSSEVFTVLNNVDGVRHVTALTINGSGDLTLTGPAALPTPGALTVTVA